ncbi:MAG: cyclic nucleotide-binding domain-containing protein [Thermoplasmata archaeon]
MKADSEPSTVRMLSAVPMFSMLGDKLLKRIVKGAKERNYAAGEKIVSQGERGIGFYLILSGKVEVRSNGKTVTSLGPAQFFGEMALFDDQPRTADVVAETPCRCLVVSAWEFWGFLANEPETLRMMFQETIRRIRPPKGVYSE